MVERERETIVTTDTGDRGGGGTVLAIVLLLVLLIVAFLAFNQGWFSGGGTDQIDVKVETPATGK